MDCSYPTRRHHWLWRDLGGEVVIVSEDGLEIRLLNKTAARIWTLADGRHSLRDVGNALSAGFVVTEEEAAADALAFCQDLLEAGLIEMLPAPTDGVNE
ncbi:MAG: PqqD family protein [Anaerolineae bacterium]